MGRLAKIALTHEHENPLTWGEVQWLIEELNDSRRIIREFEAALGQRGHVIELTHGASAWGIEHTVECCAVGILNCPIHLKITYRMEELGPPLYDLDDGLYYVELQQNGEMKFTDLDGEEQ